MTDNDSPLLKVRNLRTWFLTDDGVVRAVDGLSFRIDRRQTFALVGESGCGKSVTSFSLLQLIPSPPGVILTDEAIRRLRRSRKWSDVAQGVASGAEVDFEGLDLLRLDEKQLRFVRGGQISMIFQEPMSSLNPVFTCGAQIVEAIRLHTNMGASRAARHAVEMLGKVGIPDPARRFNEYPHQLSGGMRQRAMIAMALSCTPRLLIADEPTTALDVTIQAQILDLLNELQEAEGLSILLITHDLAVVAETADVVAVMYASKIVELASVESLFGDPKHPYTHGLFRSLPKLGERRERLETIAGTVPNPLEFPRGCKFHPRCPLTRARAGEADANETVPAPGGARVLRRCAECEPTLREIRPNHWTACWEVEGDADAAETDPTERSIAARTAAETS